MEETDTVSGAGGADADGGSDAGSTRAAYFGATHGWIDTPVLARTDLDETPRAGPLVVEEYDATVVAPPGASVFVDAWNNIRIDVDPSA